MFLGLPNLEELWEMAVDASVALAKLSYLWHLLCRYLGQGELSEVPADLFQHISFVEHIDLTDAQLQTIPEGLFDPLTLSSTNVWVLAM